MKEFLEPKENSVTQAKSKKYLKSSHKAVKLTEETVCSLTLELGEKTVPRPGIIQNSCELVLRIWTRDLQIFSLTLSQLSYLGGDGSTESNVK